MRARYVLALAALAVLVAPAAASAHANLVRLRPANGVVLATAPTAVRVLFDDAIQPGPGIEAVRNGGLFPFRRSLVGRPRLKIRLNRVPRF